MMGHAIREIYTAIVTDNDDPEKRGRIRAYSGALNAEGTDLPEWIEPCFPAAGVGGASGFFFVPQVNDVVEIERVVTHTDDDALGLASIVHPDTHWRCMVYSSIADVPVEFKRGYPARCGLKTVSGQSLVFDDDASSVILTSGDIRLASESATEPLVLGDVLKAMLSSFLDAVAVHTHTCPAAAPTPTSAPLNAASFAALKSSPVDDGAMLSAVVTTE